MNPDLLMMVLKILALLALVALNGFFVVAEFALVKVRETQLEPLIAKGDKRARVAQTLATHLDATIVATQLGITLASLGLGVLVEPVFRGLLMPVFAGLGVESEAARHTAAIALGFLVNTFLLMVVGELMPKGLAIRRTLPAAMWTAPWLARFARITYPVIWLLKVSAQRLLRQLGVQAASEMDLGHSEEELRLLFAAAQKRRGGTRLGRDIVLNALDLQLRIVRSVMRPRQEIVALSTEASLTECLDVAEKTRFSRFPLCERGDLDRTLGVVHLKDLFAMRFRAKSGMDLLPVAKKIIYVPETARLEKLLQLLLDRKLHLAVVVDEFGGTEGLVTLENILEELVGQIQDEFDQEKPMLVQTGADTWELLGTLPVHHLAEVAGEPLDGEDVVTVSGWVTRRLGGFPKVGDVLMLGNCELRVAEVDGLRVARLTLRRLAKSNGAEIPAGV